MTDLTLARQDATLRGSPFVPVSSRGQDTWFSATGPGFESPYRYQICFEKLLVRKLTGRSSFLRARLPVHDHGERSIDVSIRLSGHQQSLPIGAWGVIEPSHVWETKPHLEQHLRRAPIERLEGHFHFCHHHFSVGRGVEELLAICAPARLRPAPRRDRQLTQLRWVVR